MVTGIVLPASLLCHVLVLEDCCCYLNVNLEFFVLLQDGVCLGADTRATEGMVVADKNCSKIHYISSNM